MIPLDRGGWTQTNQWNTSVQTAIDSGVGDHAIFVAESAVYEQLPLAQRKTTSYKAHPNNGLPVDGNGKSKWPPKWRDWKSVKKKLLAISNNKCSYCESGAGADQHGQVEHWKPKSLFPTGAYDWGNYLYSCELCNHTKTNRWPDNGSYVRPDVPGFDPAVFAFGDDGSMISADADAKATIDDFGMDRQGLRDLREVAIEAKLKPLRLAVQAGVAAAQVRIIAAGTIDVSVEPYSRAAGEAVRRWWGAQFPGEPVL